MLKQTTKISKIGILLTGIGVIIGVILIFVLVAIPIFKEAHAGELGFSRLPAITEFVLLSLSDTIQLHVVLVECVALAFLIAGLVTIYCARLRLHKLPPSSETEPFDSP
jgi:hypothetical protein